jgi:MFS family permease
VAAAVVGFLMQGLTDPLSLAVSLFFLGIFLGVVLNTVETWVNACIPDDQRGRWLAVHCTIFTLFQLCGPVLLQELEQRHAFHVCALLMLSAWPLYRMLSARKLNDEADLQNDSTSWFIHLRGAPVVVVSTALFALFDTLVLALLPIYALAQGMDTGMALASASVVLAGDTSLEIVIGVLADRFGRVRVHATCAIVLMGSALLLPFTIGTKLWWPLLFSMGGSAGGIYVLSMMACGQRFKGSQLLRVTALLGSVWGVASIVGPLITGTLMARSIAWSIPVVVFSMAAFLLAALIYERRKGRTI